MDERPLRVWLYRGWCWICRECHPTPGDLNALDRMTPLDDGGLGYGYPDQPSALGAALAHRHREPTTIEKVWRR